MAQSTMARSPLGVHFFWDKSHQPELDWEKWLATVKLAIMVKENIQVDKILQTRPENEELDYPTEPHYEPALPDKTTAERREGEQRNVKRRTDWQNTCREIEDKGPQVDKIPRDEADNKTKSHIYLSLGTQATNIFHQRFPHTDIQKCTTDALVEQLREAFIHTRNETFDRFQFFRCRQKEGESLEIFHSRIKRHASVCNWDHLEESLVKSIFIQGMNNQQIQMDLLSEERTPSETLQYALARERGQESQQKMINSNTNTTTLNTWFEKIQYTKRQNKAPILPTPQSGQIQDCRRCGNKFFPCHLNVCPAKNEVCRICKKIWPFRKTLQIRNAPTITIQYATTTTTKLLRPTKLFRSPTTKQKQPTGYEKDTTENEKHK